MPRLLNRTFLMSLLALGVAITSPALAWNSPTPDDRPAHREIYMKVAGCRDREVGDRFTCAGHRQSVCQVVCKGFRWQPNTHCRYTGKSC